MGSKGNSIRDPEMLKVMQLKVMETILKNDISFVYVFEITNYFTLILGTQAV